MDGRLRRLARIALIATAFSPGVFAPCALAQSTIVAPSPAQAVTHGGPEVTKPTENENRSTIPLPLTNDVQAPTFVPALNAAIPRPPAKPKIVLPPPGPPVPARSAAAILQVLDKVTAETLRFAAPVGQRVRYKSIIFTVKTCETRGLGTVQPQPAVYLVIDSVAGAGRSSGVSRQVFKGWMFANAPGLHALEHPVYDAWLIACSTALPP